MKPKSQWDLWGSMPYTVSDRQLEQVQETLKALHGLAQQYHDRCNAFDRMVCTGKSPRSGDVLPANGREQGMINKNARQVHEDIVRQGFVMGFTEKQIIKDIQDYGDKR